VRSLASIAAALLSLAVLAGDAGAQSPSEVHHEIAVRLEIAAGSRAEEVDDVRAGQGDDPLNDRPNVFIYKCHGRHLYVRDRL